MKKSAEKKGMDELEAVEKATQTTIETGYLVDYLKKINAEAKAMILAEFEESPGTVLTDSFPDHYPCISAADGDMYLLSKHWVRYLASRASIGKYGAHCPKSGFPPMSRL